MGIDFYIVALEQITDESAWRSAMHEVRRRFEHEDYFKIHVADDYIPSVRYEQVLAQVGVLRNLDVGKDLAKKILDFVQDDVCRPENFDLIELTEPSNFAGLDSASDWCIPKKDEALLRADAAELDKFREDDTSGSRFQFRRLEAEDALKQLRSFEEAAPEDKARLTEMVRRNKIADWRKFHGPPTLYEFQVGEHPRLPLFGRHFLDCSSKISGRNSGNVEVVLRQVSAILQRHFPGKVTSYRDDSIDEFPKLVAAPDSNETRAPFYAEIRRGGLPGRQDASLGLDGNRHGFHDLDYWIRILDSSDQSDDHFGDESRPYPDSAPEWDGDY